MQTSETKQQFEEHWDKLFGKQQRLTLVMPKELGAYFSSVASLTIRAAAWLASSRM
jgi:hypothetical protein